ncbi:MAG: TonB-dependent receptor, partial [Gemmatimonadota bacterium]
GNVNPDPKNETFISFETGLNYKSVDRAVAASFNAYFTQWNDRTLTRGVVLEDGSGGLVSLLGMDARHMGLEAELSLRISDAFRLDVGASVANWKYTDDVSGDFQESPGSVPVPFDFFVDNLKVGDAPQRQVSIAASVFPADGVFIQVVGRALGQHYAFFNPFDRTDPDDRGQGWQVPAYGVFDAHASYTLPETLRVGNSVRLFLHVFNLADNTYILEAVDNSSFNAFDRDRDADDAEVFFGLGRRINLGMQVGF